MIILTHVLNCSGRPGLPNTSNSYSNGTSPTSQRPSSSPYDHSSSGSIDTPYGMPVPEPTGMYGGNDSIYSPSTAGVQRQTSARPAGAGAPYNGQYEVGYPLNGASSPGGKNSNGVSVTKPHYVSVDPKLNTYTPTHLPSNSISFTTPDGCEYIYPCRHGPCH